MENNNTPTPETEKKEPVSAEMLREEYEKKTVLTGNGALKKKRSSIGTAGKIVIGVLVAALIVGGYFLTKKMQADDLAAQLAAPTPEPTASLTIQVIDRKIEDFKSVTVSLDGGEKYTIDCTTPATAESAGAYCVRGNEEFILNGESAYRMAYYATNMYVNRLVAENVTDFAQYGLDKPSVSVDFKYKDGTTDSWQFGSSVPTTDDSLFYCTRKGSGKVYLAYATCYAAFHNTLKAIHFLPANTSLTDANQVADFQVKRPGEEPVEIRYAQEGEENVTITTLIMVQPFKNGVSSERAQELFEGAIGIQIDGYAGTMEELADVSGLTEEDDNGTMVQVIDKDGLMLMYYVGNTLEEDGTHAYVRIAGDDVSVYTAKADTVSFISNCTPQYVADQFSGIVFINNVDAISVECDGNTYGMRIERATVINEKGEEKVKGTYYFDDALVEEKLFKALYTDVIGSLYSRVSDDFHLEGDTVLKIHYDLNVEPGTYDVEFITYDDEYYAVRRYDGLTVYLIKKERVQSIIDAMARMRAGEYTIEK